MLEKFPWLLRFCRLYWNQMGTDTYGTIECALQQMVIDGGEEAASSFRRELAQLAASDAYAEWLKGALYDRKANEQVSGRFVMADEVPILLAELERLDPHRRRRRC